MSTNNKLNYLGLVSHTHPLSWFGAVCVPASPTPCQSPPDSQHPHHPPSLPPGECRSRTECYPVRPVPALSAVSLVWRLLQLLEHHSPK